MTHKTCSKCHCEKLLTEFRIKNKDRNIYNSWCKECFRSYERNKFSSDSNRRDTQKATANERRKKLKKIVWDYLLDNPCISCTNDDPRVLEFDHIDPDNKEFCVSERSP